MAGGWLLCCFEKVAHAYAFVVWRWGQSVTIMMRVQERQEINLACVIFTLLGSSCLKAVAGSARNLM
jgi:hypothetical protein